MEEKEKIEELLRAVSAYDIKFYFTVNMVVNKSTNLQFNDFCSILHKLYQKSELVNFESERNYHHMSEVNSSNNISKVSIDKYDETPQTVSVSLLSRPRITKDAKKEKFRKGYDRSLDKAPKSRNSRLKQIYRRGDIIDNCSNPIVDIRRNLEKLPPEELEFKTDKVINPSIDVVSNSTTIIQPSLQPSEYLSHKNDLSVNELLNNEIQSCDNIERFIQSTLATDDCPTINVKNDYSLTNIEIESSIVSSDDIDTNNATAVNVVSATTTCNEDDSRSIIEFSARTAVFESITTATVSATTISRTDFKASDILISDSIITNTSTTAAFTTDDFECNFDQKNLNSECVNSECNNNLPKSSSSVSVSSATVSTSIFIINSNNISQISETTSDICYSSSSTKSFERIGDTHLTAKYETV
jgi:hypothetical protein